MLVNNVGARACRRDSWSVTDEQWDELWQLNVMSYVRAIRAVVPGMRERGGGVIVNVSSTAGEAAVDRRCRDYSVTKAAVLSLSRLVADLYAKDGIRCNAVTPGPTATEAWLGEGGLADQQARAQREDAATRCSRRSARAGRSAGSPSRRRSPRWSRSSARTAPPT